MPQQKLKVYQHAIIWSNGEVSIGGGVAFDAGGAGAFAMMLALRGDAPPAADAVPTGVHVVELSADWLRQALRVIETGTGTAAVLSLVKGSDTHGIPSPDEDAAKLEGCKNLGMGAGPSSRINDVMPETTEEPQWTDWLRRQQTLTPEQRAASRGWPATPEQEPEPPAA